MAVTAYPWGSLEPVSRGATRAAVRAGRALRASAAELGHALSDLLELSAELVVKRLELGHVPALSQTPWLGGSGLAIGLTAEPAMATFLASRVLRQREPLTDPREPLSAPLLGLVSALAVEAARKSGLTLSLLGAAPIGDEALIVDAALVLDGRPYGLRAYVVGYAPPADEPSLHALGELVLRVPLVIATTTLQPSELVTLEVGAALLLPPEAGLGEAGPTRGVLVAPASERGIEVQLRPDGRLVVGGVTEARLTVERERPTGDEGETLTDVLLDTPVVVRVELGAVSMSARELAQLGPGDIIETAQRIAEPVVLRVSGREVGRGELVNVDGQVGVRIQKLYEVT